MADMTVFKNIRSDLGSLSVFEIGNGDGDEGSCA